jgi:uncharacterized protein
MTRAWATSVPFVLLWAGPAAQGPAPLDCVQPPGKVALAVCRDPSLTALDSKVEAAYAAALRKGVRTPETVEAEQRGFVQQRDACLRRRDAAACLQVVYVTRVSELQAIHGLVPVTRRARLACEGEGPQAIEATFFASEAPAALLNAGTREVLAFWKPSASGARYEGDGVVFRDEGDEAQVSWEEIELRCRIAPR